MRPDPWAGSAVAWQGQQPINAKPMHKIDECPPQWSCAGWTVTLDPTSPQAAPRYLLLDPEGQDQGSVASLRAAREVIRQG